MVATPQISIQDHPDVLPAVRELLSQHPSCLSRGVLGVTHELHVRGYVTREPHETAVEAALEALTVEGEVLA